MTKHITADNCMGCLACEAACRKGAVSHTAKSGFVRPTVDEKLCVDCGACINVCPKLRNEQNDAVPLAYAVKSTDAAVLSNSTSGGMFSALADEIVRRGGVIYGCEILHDMVVHTRTESDYSGMRGSKYVQSDLAHSFGKTVHDEILKDLTNGRTVLFTDTPCQCASVRKYLSHMKASGEKLILADLICHGTPSPKIFADYIAYCEEKQKTKIATHLFRTKLNGWTRHTEANVMQDGQIDAVSYEAQLFKSIFYSHIAMNEACFSCPYTTLYRPSDITMADFWGVKKSHPELFDESGVSFVLINTEKGKDFFDSLQNIEIHSVSPQDADQPMLKRPTQKPEKYESFWQDYEKRGFEYVVKKYYHGGRMYRLMSKIYRTIIKE